MNEFLKFVAIILPDLVLLRMVSLVIWKSSQNRWFKLDCSNRFVRMNNTNFYQNDKRQILYKWIELQFYGSYRKTGICQLNSDQNSLLLEDSRVGQRCICLYDCTSVRANNSWSSTTSKWTCSLVWNAIIANSCICPFGHCSC